MNNESPEETSAENARWLRDALDRAVRTLSDGGIFDSAMIEVKPAWALPGRYLVGMAREQGEPLEFRWFLLADDAAFDHIAGSNASNPREALRHFSMKWQLDAESLEQQASAKLIELAEALYAIADDERFWRSA